MIKNLLSSVGLVTLVFVVASFVLNLERTRKVDNDITPLHKQLDECLRQLPPPVAQHRAAP